MPGLVKPVVFEKGDKVYFVGPVTKASPTGQDIEEYAFGRSIIDENRLKAPNDHIAWFGGHYVEADIPNGNGAMWRGSEIALKSLTPSLMPVTVMHDPSTAVGLIADTKLKLAQRDGVPRNKIDTALALWSHRFPDAVAEATYNHEHGTLMQSMECLAPDYECADCGQQYHRLPDWAEKEHWCAHLQGADGSPGVRTLLNVCFTGTGLIFGSRGARGADPSAHLEAFQDEVAEYHSRASHRPSRTAPLRRKHKMDEITLDRAEYDRLKSERDEYKTKLDAMTSEKDAADEAKAAAEKEAEEAEAAKVKAETEKAALQTKLDTAEETARQATLRDERLEKLGAGFTAKLGSKTSERLKAQATSMSDEDWTARLEELEELVGAKSDAAADGSSPAPKQEGSEFSREEVAQFRGGSGSGSGSGPVVQSPAARRSVITRLTK